VRVYRYRTGVGSGLNPNLGGITAIGFRPDGTERVDGTWQLLLQGSDYYLDPSALWFALATKADQNDYLAVSYVTVSGTRVGTFPAVDNPAVTDSLQFLQQFVPVVLTLVLVNGLTHTWAPVCYPPVDPGDKESLSKLQVRA
jgi:hypothetical protein